jgi:hypothetical protein
MGHRVKSGSRGESIASAALTRNMNERERRERTRELRDGQRRERMGGRVKSGSRGASSAPAARTRNMNERERARTPTTP